MDLKGFEPSTSALRTQRSPNWATSPWSNVSDCFIVARSLKNARKNKRKRALIQELFLKRRRDRIWTCDLYVPNVALYQAEPHAVLLTRRQQGLYYHKRRSLSSRKLKKCKVFSLNQKQRKLSLKQLPVELWFAISGMEKMTDSQIKVRIL